MTENKFEVNSTRTQQEEPVALIRVDRMYESLRYNDYSAQNGLGEIVDNSVEAKAAHRRDGNCWEGTEDRKEEGYRQDHRDRGSRRWLWNE